MTNEAKKPGALYEAMRLELQQEVPPGSHALTEHLAAIKWLCARLEVAEERLAKLAPMRIDGYIGKTEHGDEVFGYEATEDPE